MGPYTLTLHTHTVVQISFRPRHYPAPAGWLRRRAAAALGACIHRYLYISFCIYIFIYMYMYIYIYIYVCMYIYVYMYIYMYVCVCDWGGGGYIWVPPFSSPQAPHRLDLLWTALWMRRLTRDILYIYMTPPPPPPPSSSSSQVPHHHDLLWTVLWNAPTR